LSADGYAHDPMSVAAGLLLTPKMPVASMAIAGGLNCTGEPWDELAIVLQSMPLVRYSNTDQFRLMKRLAGYVFRRPSFGLEECPLAVLSLVASLTVVERRDVHLYQAFSMAVMHLLTQLESDIFTLSAARWPVFQPLGFLEPVVPGVSWSSELSRLRYVCVPKTGGTTIEMYGNRHGYTAWGEVGTCPIAHCSAEFWRHDLEDTFCTVRNPYDRILSAALWRGALTAKAMNNWIQENVPQVWDRQDVEDNLLLPSHAFVVSSSGERKCKHVLHTEHLSAEFCRFLRMRLPGLDRTSCMKEMELFPVNVNLKPLLSVLDFSNSTISLINDVYRMDFEMFGYPMHTDSVALASRKQLHRPMSKRGWMMDDVGHRHSRYFGRAVVT